MRTQDKHLQAVIQALKENNEMHENEKKDREDSGNARKYMESLGIRVF